MKPTFSLPLCSGLWALLTLATAAHAQDNLTAREGDPPLDSNYYPVNLDGLANDAQSLAAPSERVQVWNVPFKMAKGGNLFLKPIGWSGATGDVGNEYPGYIARYDNRPVPTDKARAMVQVPMTDYQYVWMLAAADNDRSLSNVVTFRIGIADGQARLTYHDYSFTVPRADENPSGNGVMKSFAGPGGKYYLMRLPLATAIAQDFRERRSLDFDITKELHIVVNQPDPNRFQIRPLGPASGVHIYALTLQKSPFELEVTSNAVGNVYNEPEKPVFHLNFNNTEGINGKYTIETTTRRDDGVVATTKHPELNMVYYRSYANGSWRRDIDVPVQGRGQYELDIKVTRGDELIARRHTTFAILAPDTRKYRAENPFGTWDFGGVHFTPNDPDLLGPLYVKAGLHYGMASSLLPEWGRQKYGIANGSDARVRNGDEVKAYIEANKKNPDAAIPPRFLTFHESAISGEHLTRTPDVFTGKQYKFSEAEQKAFDNMWKEAEASFKGVRQYFPNADIYFGNTVQHVLEEFLRRKFPRNELQWIGNESGNFMRMPETQPTDSIANNSGLWMLREIADHYGYKDLPLAQCLEIGYPDSNPGNLTEETQAAYFIRNIMQSLAWRIPIIRPGCITDMGNSYYFSNWGAAGFCHAYPTVTPKQAYVAIATMTQVIDGGTFTREVPSGSSVIYAMEFKKKDGGYVTCLWTVRGKRQLTLGVAGGKATAIGMSGRETVLEAKNGQAVLEISNDPCYVLTRQPLRGITPGIATYEGRPAAENKPFLISALGNLGDWAIDNSRDSTLETYNFLNPRRKGDFGYRQVASFEGESNVLAVKPNPVRGPVYLQMYSALNLNTPVEIPGQPTEIGLMVNGNGGFGRAIFELEDAGGQKWTSIGAEQAGDPGPWMADFLSKEEYEKLKQRKAMGLSDWNSDDAWGRSFINFDGWRFLKLQMPGQYPLENHNWPRNSQWRCVKANGDPGDGIVKYPLKFKRLIITMPEKVLHATQYAPAKRQEIYLKDLMVTYAPFEQAFANE